MMAKHYQGHLIKMHTHMFLDIQIKLLTFLIPGETSKVSDNLWNRVDFNRGKELLPLF